LFGNLGSTGSFEGGGGQFGRQLRHGDVAFSATFSKRNARCGSSLAWLLAPHGRGGDGTAVREHCEAQEFPTRSR